MAITRRFKGNTDKYGYGYFGYIEDGQLVLGESWPREGGVTYRGTYRDAANELKQLKDKAPRLYNSITKYYEEKQQATEEIITLTFNDSRDSHGNGWYGYIEDGKLVIGHEAPREGGILFRGTYEEAAERGWIATLLREDLRLYDNIERYFSQKRAKAELEKAKKDYGFEEETKTILFKVKLHSKSGVVHNCLVRGRFQADVIKKLMPSVPEVLTIQTASADVFAIRSAEISAIEFVDKWEWED